jgi:hypothetical protein
MTSPLDSDAFVREINDTGEDPLGLFPSEQQPLTPPPRRAVLTTVGRFTLLIGALFRIARRVVLVSYDRTNRFIRLYRIPKASLPSMRLPRLHLSAPDGAIGRLPGWRLPRWRVPAIVLPPWCRAVTRARISAAASGTFAACRRIDVGRRVSTTTVSAFACGIVVGGSAIWLSGASRHAVVKSTAPTQSARGISQGSDAAVATPLKPSVASRPALRNVQTPTEGSPPPERRRPLFRGSLIINSRPSGARVFLNGRSVGTTPLVLRNQAAGSRAVRVALDGYDAWSSAVQVVANTETHLRAELKAGQSPAER